MNWEHHALGLVNLVFFDREGNNFNGTVEEFARLHGDLSAFKNTRTGMIVVLNQHGEVAAKGTKV